MLWGALNTITKSATGVDLTAAIVKLFKAKASREAADASREEKTATEGATKAQKENTAADVQDEVVEQVTKKRKGKRKGKTEPPTFTGKSGRTRQFAGYRDKKPIDQHGDIIGKEYYKQAGLDETGKLLKAPKTPKAPKTGGGGIKGMFKSAFGKGAGASAGAYAAAIGVAAAVVIAAAVAIDQLNKAYNKNELAA
jgi:hypothetical protein